MEDIYRVILEINQMVGLGVVKVGVQVVDRFCSHLEISCQMK